MLLYCIYTARGIPSPLSLGHLAPPLSSIYQNKQGNLSINTNKVFIIEAISLHQQIALTTSAISTMCLLFIFVRLTCDIWME